MPRMDSDASGRKIRGITAPFDPTASIKAWVSTLLQCVPRQLQDRVISKLVQALPLRSAGLCSKSSRQGWSGAASVWYAVTVDPGDHHLRLCKIALHQRRFPILIVPDSSLLRARKLVRRAGMQSRIEILGLETVIVSSILLEIGKWGSRTTSTWEAIISAYNRSFRNGNCHR